jgi:small subunit ribosomal protein S2
MTVNTSTKPLQVELKTEVPAIDLKEMLAAGLHFGHKTSRWHPKMRPFIWGAKNHVHLIDVSKTAILLERAGNFIKESTSQGGVFLWVGTKKPAQAIVQKLAMALGMPYVINRWVGGTLSNFEQIKKAITRLLHLRDVVKKSAAHYTKKEIVVLQKEIARLEKNVGGIIELDYPPAGIIIIDANKEHSTVKEASRLGLPIIGMIDTNTDPSDINLVVPANDDSPKAIAYVMEYFAACAAVGKKIFTDKKAEEKAAALAAQKAAKDKFENARKEAIKAKEDAAKAKPMTSPTPAVEKKAVPAAAAVAPHKPAVKPVAKPEHKHEAKPADKEVKKG